MQIYICTKTCFYAILDWDTTTMNIQSVDVKLWQDSWDDDAVLDPDFSLQLR